MSGAYVVQGYDPPPSTSTVSRASSASAWGLALAPAVMVVLLEALMVAGVPGTIRLHLRLPLALALVLTLVLADRVSLKRAGIRAPGFGWALLGPVYLFLRPRTAGPSVAMGVTWFASFVAWLVVPTLLASTVGVHISTDRIAHRMQADLERETGQAVTVNCPPPMTVRIGESFDCAISSGRSYATATVTVFSHYGGYGTQIKAVPPPTGT